MKASLPRFAYAIAVLLVGSYGYVALRGPRGLSAVAEKRIQIRELRQQINDASEQAARTLGKR